MGAKTWMLVRANGEVADLLKRNPSLDHKATEQLALRLFPNEKLELIGNGDLSQTCPPDDEIHLGSFANISIVAAKEFAPDRPSRLPERFLSAVGEGDTYLHAMHSAVDWLAFAKWADGKLIRSLSVSPDNGVIEEIGERLPFEEPYWNGQHPATEDEEGYPLPFHPLELGEAALKEFFGYQLEGLIDSSLIAPESVLLLKFRRKKSKWKFW